ncbi:MAG: hypothetical protein RBS02_02930 [Steroidobacteraceae bacterium]|jgi:nitric oxide reductase NorD protein|nr:hypothetical protein [Steroidobacteraceae bacterium]
MAEAEDVITDAARYATIFVRDLWRRNRRGAAAEFDLTQFLHRLDLLIAAALGQSWTLRTAQPPPPAPLLRRIFRREEFPAARVAIPATDGATIWLPAPPVNQCSQTAREQLRLMGLQQAMRACRRAPEHLCLLDDPLQRAVFETLEARRADAQLRGLLPGLGGALLAFRRTALAARPAPEDFPACRRPLELWIRESMEQGGDEAGGACTPHESATQAREIAARLLHAARPAGVHAAGLLFRDAWLGELREAACDSSQSAPQLVENEAPAERAARSARLARRPNVRPADERDERSGDGVWMVQTAQPHEHAEDPFGAQRPTDRDEDTAAEEFAESVSELAEARLIAAPGAPKEVLLSEDPPPAAARRAMTHAAEPAEILTYPEWDWRAGAYREPGATVHLLEAQCGPADWVARTLTEHRAMLNGVRRQFESLRAQRMRLRQQNDGEELDLEACIDALADSRAGVARPPGLYQCTRTMRREMAVLLLIDVSGSTDAWIASRRRIIDVEREALLLVCLALESLGERYSVLAFSGEGPSRVTIRAVKRFSESYGEQTALRIAGLEPERYTRAGAAIRHASQLLLREPARHRLLLMLSDGKPNDMDEYDGRYGLEDMRQAIAETRLQGVYPFCLTVDRRKANYLPAVFGEHQYAVLHRPELLPAALLGWLRRLVKG